MTRYPPWNLQQKRWTLGEDKPLLVKKPFLGRLIILVFGEGKWLIICIMVIMILPNAGRVMLLMTYNCYEFGVSKNGGTPKWMVYNGKPY